LAQRPRPVTLLVVPGHAWTPGQIEHLRDWAQSGHPLAAHAWHHRTVPRRLYHRLHAALISRNVAEHLDLDAAAILELLHRSKDWFGAYDLPPPRLYVPPAWALGPLRRQELAQVPFKQLETTRGLIHLDRAGEMQARQVRFQKLPLTGYEADTRLRAAFLLAWNVAQAALATRNGCPLRISIHPNDLALRLTDQLDAQIRAVDHFVDYATIAAP
jgi:hypothetical protein